MTRGRYAKSSVFNLEGNMYGIYRRVHYYVCAHTHVHVCYPVVDVKKWNTRSCVKVPVNPLDWQDGKGFDASWLLHSDSKAAVNSFEWWVCVTTSKDDLPNSQTGSRKFDGEVGESSVTWEVLHRKRQRGAPSGVITTNKNNKISKEKVNSCSCVCFFVFFSTS